VENVDGNVKDGDEGRINEKISVKDIKTDALEIAKPEAQTREWKDNYEEATELAGECNEKVHAIKLASDAVKERENADRDLNSKNDCSDAKLALENALQRIDDLLNYSAASSGEERTVESIEGSCLESNSNAETNSKINRNSNSNFASNSASKSASNAADEAKNAATPTTRGGRTKRRRLSCYNCVILIMDATLLILSLLYPILMKTKSKVTFAEQYLGGDGGSVAAVASSAQQQSQSQGHALYARGSPQTFFSHGSPWQNLLVEDIFDGDLTTLKSHVGAAEWTLVLYYAPWDADSATARNALANAAVTAAASGTAGASSSAILAASVQFAAINCWWRHGSCKSRVTKNRPFPYVYAYNVKWKGYLYQGAHDEKGYLDFLDRLIHPYQHLTSAAQLTGLVATRDTVILAHLDASNAVFNVTFGAKRNGSSPLRAFYEAALHFTQAPHHLSFQFLLVTSPSLAEAVEVPAVNTMRVFKSLEASTLYNVSASTANGLVAMLDRNAASAAVSLVSKIPSSPQLVQRLSSTNVTFLLLGPSSSSAPAFHPAYHEFRETALWFRACANNYHQAFRNILASSNQRFEAQHFCCDYRDEDEDFYFEKDSTTPSSSSFSSASSSSSRGSAPYFGPHLPNNALENQICKKNSCRDEKNSVATCAKNITARGYYHRPRRGGGGGEEVSSPIISAPLPPASSDSAVNRHWSRRCRQFIENPSLCRRRLTKTAAGVVEDGVLSVPSFAGLSCRSNRTFGFRYVVAKDFPTLSKRFGLLRDDDGGVDGSSPSLVILDNEAEEAFVMRRVEKTRGMGEFVLNFTRKLLTPFRRSAAGAGESVRDRFSRESCLKRNAANISSRNSSSSSRASSSPTIDSSPIPSTACVLELSSHSLRSLLAEGREVALLFYSKTCGLCKTFNRYFLRLSQLFGDSSPAFRLARIDVDENDLPINLTVGAVPAIIFFRGVNFSRSLRPADARGEKESEGRRKTSSSSSSSSFPQLSLRDLLSFVLRHVKDSSVREKLASRLCDATCLKSNLEDARRGAAELKRRKDALVQEMLLVNDRVKSAEREMLYHVDRCAGVKRVDEGVEEAGDDAFEECRATLEALNSRVEGFARRLEVKGDRLASIERKAKAFTRIEAKIAWALHKKN